VLTIKQVIDTINPMSLNMDNYVEIKNLEEGELRRLMVAITDLCAANDYFIGKVAIQHPEETTTLLVDIRKLLMVIEDSTATLLNSQRPVRVSKDQLAFDF